MNAILDWMKDFLILYLILTILTHLAAAEEYKKYLRFLSGIILLLVLISPLLRLRGSDSGLEILQSYDDFWENMDDFPSNARQAELLQDERGIRKFEKAVAADMTSQAKEQGIQVSRISVNLSENYEIESVSVWLDMRQKQEDHTAKERLLSMLQQTYHLEDRQIFID